MSKIDDVVELMSRLREIGHGLSFLLFLGAFIYCSKIRAESFGEKAVADGWPKDLAPRIFVGVHRILFMV